MLHYALHHTVPSGRLGRALRERHMRHHFQDDTKGFGISAPYWDDVFSYLADDQTRGARRQADLTLALRSAATASKLTKIGKERPRGEIRKCAA